MEEAATADGAAMTEVPAMSRTIGTKADQSRP